MTKTHGHGGKLRPSRTYMAWCNMKKRCNYPNFPQWKDWGGRGITYDHRWDKFEAFLKDMGEAPSGFSLDRKDNDKNYSKKNCRWTDVATQRRNARNVHMVNLDGKQVCLKDYCAAKGLRYGTEVMKIWRCLRLKRQIT